MLGYLASFGQGFFSKLDSYDNDYREVIKEAEEYFKTRDHGKGTGWKQYQRWKWELQYHLDVNENVISQKQEREAEYEYSRKALKRSRGRRNTDAGNESDWIEKGPGRNQITSSWSSGMARTYDVQVSENDPNIIYASTSGGGVWKSTDGGFNWAPITDQLPLDRIFSLAIDPNNDNHVLIYIKSHGLYTTFNGGSSWVHDDYFSDFQSRKITFAPGSSNTIFLGGSSSLSKSTDGGATWNPINLYHEFGYSPVIEDIVFHPTNPDIIYVSSNLRLYKSTNGGDTFVQILSSLPQEGRTRIAVTKAEPSYLYIVQDYNNGFGGLYLSKNEGSTFTTQINRNSPNARNYFSGRIDGSGEGGQAYHDMAIGVSNTNADEVFIAGINIWKSTNGGQDFSINTYWDINVANANDINYVHADHHQLRYLPDGTLINCNDGGVYKSTDSGNTWIDLSNGIRARQFYKIAYAETNPSIVAGGSQDNGHSIMRSNGNWIDWLGADGMEVLISPKDENKAYGFVQSGLRLHKTINQGETRISLNRPETDQTGDWITPLIMDNDDDDVVYAGYIDFFKHNGSYWEKVHDFSDGTFITRLESCPTNSNRMYMIKSSILYRTNDKGVTWTNLNTFCHDLSVDPNNEDILVISTGSGDINISKDGGDSFTSVSKGIAESGSIYVRCIEFDHSNKDGMYLGTANTIYYTNSELSSWVPFNSNLPAVRIDEIEVVKSTGEVLAATYGRGLWQSQGYEESDFTIRPVVNILNTYRGTIEAGSKLNIIAEGSSPEGKSISQIVFDVNGVETIDSEYPFVVTLNAVSEGDLTITAKAIDEDGTESLLETQVVEIASVQGSCNADIWDPSVTYRTEGLLVQHQGKLYENKWWNSDREPGTEQYGPWTYLEDCGGDAPTNVAPTATFVSPSEGTNFPNLEAITLETSANDPENDIFIIYVFINGQGYATFSSDSYTFDFLPEVAGDYTALLISQDGKGAQSDVTTLNFSVGNTSNTPPTVSLTSPTDGQEVKDVTTVILTADAYDEDGTVTSVEFTVNGEVIVDDSAPFEIEWTPNVGGGASVPVSVVAMDNSGARSVASESFFYMFVKPVISNFFPTNEYRINGITPTTLTLNPKTIATEIIRVTLSINNEEVTFDYNASSSSTGNITYEWTPEYVGEHIILARITDNLGYRSDWVSRTYFVDPENQAPILTSISPDNESIIVGSDPVTITIYAEDPDGSIVSVSESTPGGSIQFEGTESPYTYTFDPNGLSFKQFYFAIEDDKGLVTQVSYFLNFESAVNEAPTVSIIKPTTNQVFQGLGAITLEAEANDTDGNITKVTFFVDGETIEDSTFPYEVSWNPPSAGNYTVEIVAEDNLGDLSGLETSNFSVEVSSTDECSTTPAWSATQTYRNAGNKVSYDNKIFENKWYTKNDLPTEGGAWKLLQFCGGGIDCSDATTWSSSTAYSSAGALVIYQGSKYSNQHYSKNDIPGIDDVWELKGPCLDAPSSFETMTADIYPNPGSGKMKLEVNGITNSNLLYVEVRNLFGYVLMKKRVNLYENGKVIELDMTGQPNGIYSLTINANGQVLSKTIQVEK